MSGEILFLSHRTPWPPDRGDRIRSWNVLKAIARLAPTHVVSLADPADGLAPKLEAIGDIAASMHVAPPPMMPARAIATALLTGRAASVCAFASHSVKAQVRHLLDTRPIATIYAFSGQMAQFVPEELDSRRFVMDFVDMDSAKFGAFGASRPGLEGFANRIEAKRLLRFERHTASRADVSLFVSEAEAALFRSATGFDASRVRVLENGVDLAHFDPAGPYQRVDAGGAPLIVFTGQMDYRPNVEAVRGFAQLAMPTILRTCPKAVFAVVGRAPSAEVKALAVLPGVVVTGAVPDTRDWLAAADMAVAPLSMARGVQNKVLEAMAMARPVIASPEAVEGIDAKPGRDLLLANGALAQARAVLGLVAAPEKALKLGKAARARIVARYGWEASLAPLPAILGLD